MKNYPIGSTWVNVEKTRWGYPYWMRQKSKWKFIGYSKSAHDIYPKNMSKYLNRPHKKDVNIKDDKGC